MAQWSGQFSGNTHLSKVRDRETQLRDAVEAYRKCAKPSDRDARAATVVRLAERLLAARAKVKTAQIAALDPRNADQRKRAEWKLQQMMDAGIQGVLGEFAAADIETD